MRGNFCIPKHKLQHCFETRLKLSILKILKNKISYLKLFFLIFSYRFDVLISKIIFKKSKNII
jgi:hypothetical protein